ncbi:ComEC family competence protein [Mucilaginibacter terrenus]|uniref:ComEC family competence protein n=1 Tax=Mucilaginibacter terrenus TaxID=2482727 RepID=A0A3E2NVT5_9SPHI|nr:ComEC/Rec2 family competence protein [Mucilaginibacter terrenus]RFZ84970.1 ComEC family competence protein [Mucilaginibacter terrenus]
MIAEHKGEIPVVILLLPFIGGIATGLYWPGVDMLALAITAAVLFSIFVFLNLGYSKFSVYKSKWIGGMLIYPILFLAGWLISIHHNQLRRADHFSKQQAQFLVVCINSEPVVKGEWTRFTAEVSSTISNNKVRNSSGTLLIAIKDELARNLFYGEQLLVPAKYTIIDPPFNPGEFNYKQYLAHKNVYHQAYLFPKHYKITGSGFGNGLIAAALNSRQQLVKKLYSNMHDTTAIAVASTLILGYKADLSNDVMQAYSKTGTIHILSVSGGHVAILYVVLAWALSFLNGHKKGKIIRVVVIILLIWLYALLTGLSPAVCRAALMISFLIVGKTAGRYVNPLNVLACSAFALLLYDPFLITDVGFQLSYLAVAGLIIFEPIINQFASSKNRVADYLWKATSVSTAAQAITFPLSAFYFHQLPVYFLISNLIIMIPVTVIMYSGLLLLMLPQIPVVSNLLGLILEKSILIMNKLLGFIEHLPYASISKIWLTNTEHLLLYLIIVTFFYLLYNRRRKWLLAAALFATLLFSISISIKKINSDSTQSITFLNLKKHSGIVFKNGNNGVVLTDITDTDKVFKYSIQPGLDSNRITNYIICGFDKNLQNEYLLKRGGLVQFRNKRLMILNHKPPAWSIPSTLRLDYIYIRENASVDLRSLITKQVIVDASNSDRYISVLTANQVNYQSLKRNKSIIINSNR